MNTKRTFLICSFLFLLIVSGIISDFALAEEEKFDLLMLDTPKAFVLDKGRLEGSFFYQRMNKYLNFLGVEIEKDKPDKIGEFQSLNAILNFGIWERLMFSYMGKRWDFAYEHKELLIISHRLGLRINILDKDSYLPLSLELNFKTNRLVRAEYAGYVLPMSGIEDESWFYPYSVLADHGQNSDWWPPFPLSILASKKLFKKFEIHGLLGFEGVIVNPEIKGFYQRNTFLGLVLDYWAIDTLSIQFDYKYIYVQRKGIPAGAEVSSKDKNNVVNTVASYFVKPFLALNLQGKFYSNLFIGETPFVSRQLPSRFFGKDYGYLGCGITFIYDYAK